MEVIYIILFVLEASKYYLGMKTFFSVELRNRSATLIVLFLYIVCIHFFDICPLEKRLLMYVLVILLQFIVVAVKGNSRFISILIIFLAITGLDALASDLIEQLNFLLFKNVWIAENNPMLSSFMTFAFICCLYFFKSRGYIFYQKRVYTFVREKMNFFIVIMALQMILTISSLSFAKNHIQNPKFYVFASGICILSFLCATVLISLTLYVEKTNRKIEESIQLEQKMKLLQKNYVTYDLE